MISTQARITLSTLLMRGTGGFGTCHGATRGVGKAHANNNRIERLNGTSRERIKVQRGWKSMKTTLAEGQRIHYNFVKPHEALEGQTPADAAGIGVQGEYWYPRGF
jgi:hypothetical protein